MTGDSLCGYCIGFYAEKYPEKIKALAPISTTVSGELSIKVHVEETKNWKKTGWMTRTSKTKPGVSYKLPWSHMEDRLKYNLLEKVDKLKMPLLLIVGENDEAYVSGTQKLLYDKLPGKKELHIIKGAPHTFIEKSHLREIREIFIKYIYNLD